MKISDLGEFGLIALVRQWTDLQPASGRLAIGIGDDAAAWQIGNEVMLATTDTLVEGIHFLPDAAPEDLGWKAIASNLSDIAAMGGEPGLALVTLALPGTTDVHWVEKLYSGILEAAGEYGAVVAGGDMVTSSQIVITVALTGRSPTADSLMRRSAAISGDLLAVTGCLGSAVAGLRILKGTPVGLSDGQASVMLSAHLRPRPRVSEGRMLASLGVRAAIDISDGLLADCAHLCRESGISAIIEASRLPVHPDVSAAFGAESLQMAATGGEDYELLFAAAETLVQRAREALETPLTIIGRCSDGPPGRVVLLDQDGRPLQLSAQGWEHFQGPR